MQKFSDAYSSCFVLSLCLNFQHNHIIPRVIHPNSIPLFFKRKRMGDEAIFDFLQTFMSGNSNDILLQTSVIRGCGFATLRLPGVQTDVVMITTSADKKGSRQLSGDIKA